MSFVNPDQPINSRGLLKLLPEDKMEQFRLRMQKKVYRKERRREYLAKAVNKLDQDLYQL